MRAAILAGGRGTRLRPYTASFPKPLMPMGEIPIVELLLRQLKAFGVDEVILLTGHLAYLIEGYLGDGSNLGMAIEYVREEEPLGTAGPLRRLQGRMTDDFLVMNGDLLTDADFGVLMRTHVESGAAITISTARREEQIELGVLRYGANGEIEGYDEKPKLHLDVSMGLYAMSPAVLGMIPDGYYDMPSLIADLIAKGQLVRGLPHQGVWYDIGRSDDYAAASEAFARDPGGFLPGRE